MDWNPGLQVWQLDDVMGEILSHFESAKSLGRISLTTKESVSRVWRLASHLDFRGVAPRPQSAYVVDWLNYRAKIDESTVEDIIAFTGDRLRSLSALSWDISEKSWEHLRSNCLNLTELSVRSDNLCEMTTVSPESIAAVFGRLRTLNLHLSYLYEPEIERYLEIVGGNNDDDDDGDELVPQYDQEEEEEPEESVVEERNEIDQEAAGEIEENGIVMSFMPSASENKEQDNDTMNVEKSKPQSAFVLLPKVAEHIPSNNALTELNLTVTTGGNREAFWWDCQDPALDRSKLSSFVNAFKNLNTIRFEPCTINIQDLQEMNHLRFVQITEALSGLSKYGSSIDVARCFSVFQSRHILNFNVLLGDSPALVQLFAYNHGEAIEASFPSASSLFHDSTPLIQSINFCLKKENYTYVSGFFECLETLIDSGWFSEAVDIDVVLGASIDCFQLLKQFLATATEIHDRPLIAVLCAFTGYLPTSQESCRVVVPTCREELIPAKDTNLLWTLIEKTHVFNFVIDYLREEGALGDVDSLLERSDLDGGCFSLAHLCRSKASVLLLLYALGPEIFSIFHTGIRDGAGDLPLEHLLRHKHHEAASAVMGEIPPMSLGHLILTDEGFQSFFISLAASKKPQDWLEYFLANYDLKKYQHSSILVAMTELCRFAWPPPTRMEPSTVLVRFVNEVRRLRIPIESSSSSSLWLPLAFSVNETAVGNAAYIYSEFAAQITAEAARSEFTKPSDLFQVVLISVKVESELRKYGPKQAAAGKIFLDVLKTVLRCFLAAKSDSGASQVAFMSQFIFNKWGGSLSSRSGPLASNSVLSQKKEFMVDLVDFAIQAEQDECKNQQKASSKRVHLLKALRRLLERPSKLSLFVLSCLVRCLNRATVEDLRAPSPDEELGITIAETIRDEYPVQVPLVHSVREKLEALGFRAAAKRRWW